MGNNLFESLNLSTEILKAVSDMDFTEMTKIQSQAIPVILEGRDIIGRSRTGTGKTAAFGLPLLEMVKTEDQKNPQALILCPTRELAQQVCNELRKFAKYKHGVSVAAVFGGQSMLIQIRQLKRASVVVGTPGRIIDHLKRATLKLDNVKTVVLDEADEMLNMGFLDDMKNILSRAPKQRQTLLFSATMPKAILNLTDEFLNDPLIISADMEKMTLEAVEQYYYNVPQSKKEKALAAILSENKIGRALVFCNTKKMTDKLFESLMAQGIKSAALHGDMRQGARTIVMNDYKSGVTDILVATDVAARGIDAKGIEAVINYDIPLTLEQYVHRIGRTARAGQKGAAYTLVCGKNQLFELGDIEEQIKTEIIEKTLSDPDFLTGASFGTQSNKTQKAGAKKSGRAKSDLIKAQNAFRDSGKNESFNKEAKKDRSASVTDIPDKTILSVNVGKKHNIAPNFIVSAVAGGSGISSKNIGKIAIFENHTNIELSKHDAEMVLENMKNGTIKGHKVTFKIAGETKASPDTRPNAKKSFSKQPARPGKSGRFNRAQRSKQNVM